MCVCGNFIFFVYFSFILTLLKKHKQYFFSFLSIENVKRKKCYLIIGLINYKVTFSYFFQEEKEGKLP